jgi:hypothetical protein
MHAIMTVPIDLCSRIAYIILHRLKNPYKEGSGHVQRQQSAGLPIPYLKADHMHQHVAVYPSVGFFSLHWVARRFLKASCLCFLGMLSGSLLSLS